MLHVEWPVNREEKWKGTVELTQKILGLPFFFNKYNSYDRTSYKKGERNSELCSSPTISNLTLECTQTCMAVVSFPLTYNRHCTEWHNQWKRSKGVRGKHSQFSQHQQKQSTPPSLGFEVGSGVFGTCQSDVAVFLEKKTKAKNLWHAWCFLMQDAWGRINICFMILTWRLSAILITRCPKIASNAPIKFSCKNKVNTQILNLATGPWRKLELFAQSGREQTLKQFLDHLSI